MLLAADPALGDEYKVKGPAPYGQVEVAHVEHPDPEAGAWPVAPGREEEGGDEHGEDLQEDSDQEEVVVGHHCAHVPHGEAALLVAKQWLRMSINLDIWFKGSAGIKAESQMNEWMEL